MTSPSAITQPNSFDVLDTEYFSLKKLGAVGQHLRARRQEIKEFDNITPVFTRANCRTAEDRRARHRALEGALSRRRRTQDILQDADRIRDANSDRLQRRYARHPAGPDQAAIGSWAELLNPEFKGKAAILNIPSIGIMDAAMWSKPPASHKYEDKAI